MDYVSLNPVGVSCMRLKPLHASPIGRSGESTPSNVEIPAYGVFFGNCDRQV